MNRRNNAATGNLADEHQEPESEAAAPDAEGAEAAALAARVAPTGVAGAIEWLRANMDEGAHLVWTANGPRRSQVAEVGCALVEMGEARRYVIALGYGSGGFKLFVEVPGRHASDEAVLAMYGMEPERKLEPMAQEIGGPDAQD